MVIQGVDSEGGGLPGSCLGGAAGGIECVQRYCLVGGLRDHYSSQRAASSPRYRGYVLCSTSVPQLSLLSLCPNL
ncbi:hypothetical protein E2C01_078422 [Portunus trituberculatus]|uniref:Uncharacterized protein n=1 Tax=Portunus trituberculatus TaxID=210409 RepID=A0A5B7IQ62_PORTR|nr:hypothetical protein [Portunus trituberculatus]